MVSDSITNASIPSAPTINNKTAARDLGKKKRARSAKLKQCKLDVRREQWLSSGAVKNKDGREEQHGGVQGRRERSSPRSLEEMGPGEGESVGSNHQHHHHHDSELDSNSPSSFNSSVLGGHDSETFTGSSSSSSSSGDCFSGNITEEDEDDGCLDDWEAVADALAADEKPKNQPLEPPQEHEAVAKVVPARQVVENSKPQCERAMPKAWRPDDAYRPQSLPNLAKQIGLPNSSRKGFGGGNPWACNSVVSPPSSCPICYEDLDLTDTSFLPCLCGFRLCLFCHKRILEGDGRCPGCRKPYESIHGGSLTFRLPHSCSMITGS
ncbi:uncharacterized protein LOC126795195 [Argentina anserina]|uniref:uncharacterized protein LOC126795195 n=1 Tax=Argentina anserina TaxID=57926 RepID=UPI00217622C2|nr:uncharacterized protein LOC126795195 [Potentilla anserina]